MNDMTPDSMTAVHAPRPLKRIPPPPAPSLQRELAAKARKALGMDERCSRAFAYTWVEPADLIPQIDRPRQMRIPGATLKFVEGEAWSTAVAPDVDNPRVGSAIAYPLAVDAAGQRVTFRRASSPVTSGPAELRVTSASRSDLVHQLETTVKLTREINELNPPVGEQGIMDAPIAVMTKFEFDDGSPPVVVPVIREGTSRTSHAQRRLDVEPYDVLFTYPASAAPLKRKIDEINALVGLPDMELNSDQRAAARCMVIPLIVIVGVIPDDVTRGMDLAGAVELKIGQEHINTKRPWDEDARNGALATSCLAAAARHGIPVVDSDNKRAWLSGELTRSDAEARGLTRLHPDDRFADLVYLFTTGDPRVHGAIREPIFLELQKPDKRRTRVQRSTKVPLAVELAMRGLRGGPVEGSTAWRMAAVLEAGADFQVGTWTPSQKAPKALLQQARDELGKQLPDQPAATELRVRALWYLALYDTIRGPRNDAGPGGDRRSVSALMADMAASDRGLGFLAAAIEEGRQGRPPRAVDDAGKPAAAADGGSAVASHTWVRERAFPQEKQAPQSDDPQERRLAAVDRYLNELIAAIDEAEALSYDDGTTVLARDGVPNQRAKPWLDKLSDATTRVSAWRDRYIERRLQEVSEEQET